MAGEKRKAERHAVRFHLVYDDGASFNAGTVHDLSDTGLFLETAMPLDVGTEVQLTPLDNAGQGLFEITARVVRNVPYDPDHVNPDSFRAGMGLEFVGLSDEGREQVVDMIRNLEATAASGVIDPFLGVRVPGAQATDESDATESDE